MKPKASLFLIAVIEDFDDISILDVHTLRLGYTKLEAPRKRRIPILIISSRARSNSSIQSKQLLASSKHFTLNFHRRNCLVDRYQPSFYVRELQHHRWSSTSCYTVRNIVIDTIHAHSIRHFGNKRNSSRTVIHTKYYTGKCYAFHLYASVTISNLRIKVSSIPKNTKRIVGRIRRFGLCRFLLTNSQHSRPLVYGTHNTKQQIVVRSRALQSHS